MIIYPYAIIVINNLNKKILKNKIHLTYLSSSFQKDNDIILGEWCNPNCLLKSIPYHWDDNEKMHSDFLKIDKVYENILSNLGKILNDYHKINFSKKGWRIIIGPWLNALIHTVFDRYEIINFNYNKKYLISNDYEICWYEIFSNSLLTNSSSSSRKALSSSDFLNQYIFQEIITKKFKEINKKYIKHGHKIDFNKIYPNVNFKKGFVSKILIRCISFTRKICSILGLYSVILNATRFSLFQDFFISLNNKSIYLPGRINDEEPQKEISRQDNEREYLKNKLIKTLNKSKKLNQLIDNDLINILAKLTFELIPKNFLENFINLYKKCLWENWVRGKTMILTANSYNANDTFCISTAISLENNKESKLFIIQHGGNFGTARFNSSEKHQRDISSKYLTWGWEEDSKTIPVGIIKPLKKYNIKSKKSKEVLLIAMELFRYSYVSYSGPQGPQWLNYQNRLEDLGSKIRSNNFDISVRTKPRAHCWNSRKRWENKNFKIDKEKYFFKSCRESKIIISSYNAATFLETIYMDIPTLLFWDQISWDMRPEAKEIFNDLYKVEIFHNNIESIIKTLKSAKRIGYLNWWKEFDRKIVIKNFKNKYARENKNFINTFSKLKNF
tara:strand:+ start:5516 stop:7360 length:1845 start_codon:yes stop_codon:yes gene_type:complete